MKAEQLESKLKGEDATKLRAKLHTKNISTGNSIHDFGANDCKKS